MNTELGYSIHSKEDFDSGPSWQLDINLYQHPTEEHFDPERVSIWMVEQNGDVIHTTITHPWHGRQQFQLCAGRIILYDRKDKVVEAFSLGGNCQISSDSISTNFGLVSVAPIIQLFDNSDIPTILVCEFEALLAGLEAQWSGDAPGFKRKLAGLEPWTLFIAGLVAIQAKIRRLPATYYHQKCLRTLRRVIYTIQADGRWPASVPELNDML